MKKIHLSGLSDLESAKANAFSILPPSIMPVVFLCGSDYEMGYQYGLQVGHYIEMVKNDTWVSALAGFDNRDKVIDHLKAVQRYIKEYSPEAIEQMKGISDGATAAGYEISYTDVLLINCSDEFLLFSLGIKRPSTNSYSPGAECDELPPKGCSVFSAWGSTTTDGRLICGDSKDNVFTYQVVIVAFPDVGNNYMLATLPGMVAEHFSMNNKGVFIGTNGGFAKRQCDYDWGLPRLFVIFHALRFAESASGVKDMLLSWKLPGSWNVHFSDVSGDAYVAEVTAGLKNLRTPGDFGETDFIYSTNNYFIDEMKEAIEGEKFIEHAGWLGRGQTISSVSRNLELWNMLHNYRGKVDVDFVKMMWRFSGNPPPNPLDEKAYYDTQGEGWDPKICNLNNIRVAVVLPDNGDNGVAHICTGPAGRIAYPPFPKGGDFYQIHGTHSFYQLSLHSDPATVVKSAKNTAHNFIARAYQKFMLINCTDNGYTPLNELYSQANAEYYEGVNAFNGGSLASGNEALRYFSQAATAFTRSQAHALQVCNASVPPPTTPEDLGLTPYGDV